MTSRHVPPTTRRFHVCLHDATPAYAREVELMLRGLTSLLGRRLSVGVVPDWHGEWPLAAHPGFCRMVLDGAQERLLHGYSHQRRQGRGPISVLTERSDEMNGLSAEETRQTLDRGQRVLTEVFGSPARGFLAPAWQPGRVGLENGSAGQFDHVLGHFSLRSRSGRRVPLTTWSWDCGRWGWMGHLGHGVGWLSQSLGRRVPVLAVHPRDLNRGFWPVILDGAVNLLENGYEPSTLVELLDAEVAA